MAVIGKEGENSLNHEQELKTVTESLYKQNLELAVKNKTLSLLRQLYQISILTLEPKILAEKLGDTIRETFEYELVGFFSFDKEEDTFIPMYFSQSDRCAKASSRAEVSFISLRLNQVSRHNLFAQVLKGSMAYTESFQDVWGEAISGKDWTVIQNESRVKGVLFFPLLIDEKVIGVLTIALNRRYKELIQFEKDSIQSFVNVLAVALDRAYLYQKLGVTNKELAEANDRLKELDRLKSEFLSFASHQIRAPLTAIGGYASMLLQGDFGEMPEQIRNSVKTIDISSKELIKVVNDFLDISRIEQGRMKYEMTDFDFRKAIEEIIDEFRPNMGKKGLSLEFEAAEKLSYMISGDAGKIKQVVGNIIDNAIKYTEHGGIKISLERTGSNIRLAVSDTGIGIALEDIPKLFSKFSRSRDAHRTDVTGTGLGLYLAKQLIEAHKGRIWVESEGRGHGSTFFIELPANVYPVR
ncbi:HAMP domain-containing histidine kinase [Patescibacteria group bacterium]|nr:MAG: HAMP domain-containing histidine kinase [Patescibacteria group bacterium]